MNAVISTTFGHNLGDDFIRIGVEKIFREVGPLAPVYYDRNPSHKMRGGNRWRPAIESGWADAVIIAGSPGWTEEAVPLYVEALKRDLPIYMLGIGMHTRKDLAYQLSGKILKQAVNAAKVIVVRDVPTHDAIAWNSGPESVVLPCPAMLAPRDDLPKDGPPSQPVHQVFELEKYSVYSDDPAILLEHYARSPKVRTARLHGAIVAKGAGVPEIETLWPDTDERCVETWKVVQEYEGTRQDLLDEYTALLGDFPLPQPARPLLHRIRH